MTDTTGLNPDALAAADMVMILSSGMPDLSLRHIIRMVIRAYLAADKLEDGVPVMEIAQQAMRDEAEAEQNSRA